MPQYSPNINVMLKAVRRAARSMVRDFGEVENLQVSQKGPGNFVSAADIKAEEILFEELSKARPDYGFVLEESGKVKGKDGEYRWIADPLDGTLNFLHGYPHFCTSVALEKKLPNGKTEIIASVTEVPMQQETFWAEKGGGAWLESAGGGTTRLRVAGRSNLGDALVCAGSLKRDVKYAVSLAPKVAGIRCLGSTVLGMAYVAAGRYDCFYQTSPYLWDISAGLLLVQEAGGCVTDINGKGDVLKADSIVATNSSLQLEILRQLQQAEGK